MQLEKRVAFRRAMRKAVESALRFGARGIKVRVSGPAERRGDRAVGVVPARPAAAADAARRHRLRLRRGVHDLRRDRREGVALQGRAADAARRPRRGIPAAAPRGGGGRRDRDRRRESVGRRECRTSERRGLTDVDAEESQVSQAAARPDARAGVARVDGRVRRLRADGARAVLADRSADRGGARGAHARHQARRQGLDPRVSRTSRSPRSRRKRAWARARARPKAGSPSSSRAGSCSRWKA